MTLSQSDPQPSAPSASHTSASESATFDPSGSDRGPLDLTTSGSHAADLTASEQAASDPDDGDLKMPGSAVSEISAPVALTGSETNDREPKRRRKLPLLADLPREVGVLAAIAFCVALGFGIVAPALPIFARDFGVSAFLASAVISVFALMRFVSAPGAGWLINRVGERVVLATGLMIVAVSSFLAGTANDYLQLLLMRGFGGIGSAMFTVSAMALLLRTVGPDQRGRAASAFQAGFLFGGVAGPAVGGIVVGISIRMPFFVYTATLAAATAVTLIFLRNPKPEDSAHEVDAAIEDLPMNDAEADEVQSDTKPNEQVTLLQALKNGGYRAALTANLINGVVTFGIRTSLVPLFVVESLHQGAGLAGIGFLAAAATQAICLLPAGRMTDTRGRRPSLIIGTIAGLIGVFLLALSSGPLLFVTAMAVMGIATAFLSSAPAAIVGDVIGHHKSGAVVATFQMISDFGTIIGPLAAGWIADQLGYHWAFSLGVVLSAASVVVAVAMRETKPRTTPKPL